MKRPAMTVGAVFAALALAPVAQADENSYLRQVRAAIDPYKNYWVASDSQLLQLGYTACQVLRSSKAAGMSAPQLEAFKAINISAESIGLPADGPPSRAVLDAAEGNLNC